MQLDATDWQILQLLKKNARLQWRDIGEQVHLTGQAVANRVARLEKIGIIEAYTLQINERLLGRPLTGYITVFMKSTDHQGFQSLIQTTTCIDRADRISGDGCYILTFSVDSHDTLNAFLNDLLAFGNYRVSLVIGRVK